MSREEIKDFLDVNTQEDIIEFIFNLETELLKTQRGLDAAKMIITDFVSKDRYNDIVRKYNAILKRRR